MSNIAISELSSEATSASDNDLLLLSKNSTDGSLYTSMKLKINNLKNSLITIDNSLSSTSANPVQNKVINAEIEALKNSVKQLNKEISFMNLDSIIIDPQYTTTNSSSTTLIVTEDTLVWISKFDLTDSSNKEYSVQSVYLEGGENPTKIFLTDTTRVCSVPSPSVPGTEEDKTYVHYELKFNKIIIKAGNYHISCSSKDNQGRVPDIEVSCCPLSKCRLPVIGTAS